MEPTLFSSMEILASALHEAVQVNDVTVHPTFLRSISNALLWVDCKLLCLRYEIVFLQTAA